MSEFLEFGHRRSSRTVFRDSVIRKRSWQEWVLERILFLAEYLAGRSLVYDSAEQFLTLSRRNVFDNIYAGDSVCKCCGVAEDF